MLSAKSALTPCDKLGRSYYGEVLRSHGEKLMDNNEMGEALIALTADIVTAHVANNGVSLEQVPVLIQTVYRALADLGQETESVTPLPSPAVSIRSSIKPDSLTCLECGRKMKMLKRHLSTEHGLTIDDYRTRWQLSSSYPVVAPKYAERRRDLAKAIGLGRQPSQKRRSAKK